MMDDQNERMRKLRHDLSNPLAAILAETQLLLLGEDTLDKETAASSKPSRTTLNVFLLQNILTCWLSTAKLTIPGF